MRVWLTANETEISAALWTVWLGKYFTYFGYVHECDGWNVWESDRRRTGLRQLGLHRVAPTSLSQSFAAKIGRNTDTRICDCAVIASN